VILHETLHEMRRKKRKGIIMKLDFEKAYDNVAWPFLMEVLEREISSKMDRVGATGYNREESGDKPEWRAWEFL
jgi:hypothetical protein